MEPLITVIVPVYNVEAYLAECLDSILAQTHRNLEILLVDDGSPDRCPQICDEYAQKDSRIRVIHKPNGGLSDARNAALEVATGEYIGFVDSDDWIAPDMMEYLLQGLIGCRASISCCEPTNVYTYRMEYKNIPTDQVVTAETALNELFFDRMENYAWNKLYKAELWKDVRFPVGKNFEDILTIYKTFERADRIALLREPKYFYRIRPDSISGTRDFKNRLHIYAAIVDRYEDVAPRMPKYRAPLFRRVRNYYIHELSKAVVRDPAHREENMQLLAVLAPFVAKHKDEIANELHFQKWERQKLDAFAEGTVDGCRRALKYHEQNDRRKKRKQRLKKLLKL